MTWNDRPFPFLSLIPVARSYCHMQRERERAAHSGTKVLSILASELTDWHPRPSIQAHLARLRASYSKAIPLIAVFCFSTQLYLMRTEPMSLCAKMFQHLLLVNYEQIWLLLWENVGRHRRTVSIWVALPMLLPVYGQVLTQEKATLSRLHLSPSV